MPKTGIEFTFSPKRLLFLWYCFLTSLTASKLPFLSNLFISKIAQREKDKAKQWAESVKKKGELVELSNNIFIELKKKEKEKIDVVIDAYRIKMEKSDDLSQNLDIVFSDSIISANKDIPVIVLYEGSTDPDGNDGMNQFYDKGISEPEKDSICMEMAAKWKNKSQFY